MQTTEQLLWICVENLCDEPSQDSNKLLINFFAQNYHDSFERFVQHF